MRLTIFCFLFVLGLSAQTQTWQELHTMAAQSHKAGRYTDAKRYFHAALEQLQQDDPSNPMRANLLAGLATEEYLTGDWKAAEKAYQQAIDTGKNLPAAYTGLGVLRRAQGRDSEAESLHMKAIKDVEKSAGAYSELLVPPLINLAELSRARGRFAESQRHLSAP